MSDRYLLEPVRMCGFDVALACTQLHLPPSPSITRRVTMAAMIRSFRDRDTERLAARQRVRRWSPELSRAALRKLRMLDAADELTDLRVPPGDRLERLKGDRQGQHSLRINDQWRICFRWEGGNAYDVQIVDYH
jgi:toxin HigB-1